jgi:hypothetical protein
MQQAQVNLVTEALVLQVQLQAHLFTTLVEEALVVMAVVVLARAVMAVAVTEARLLMALLELQIQVAGAVAVTLGVLVAQVALGFVLFHTLILINLPQPQERIHKLTSVATISTHSLVLEP